MPRTRTASPIAGGGGAAMVCVCFLFFFGGGKMFFPKQVELFGFLRFIFEFCLDRKLPIYLFFEIYFLATQ